MNEAMTVDEFRDVLPDNKKKAVGKMLMVKINNILTDPEEAMFFKDNLLTYAHILSTGKYKITDYVNAVRYVGFKMMNYNNKESYKRTFPDKIIKFKRENVTEKTLSAYIYAYNSTQLVNQIYEHALVPIYLVNAPALQKAINTQVEIMTDPTVSAMARTAAANSVMNHIKPPEKQAQISELRNDGPSMHEQSMSAIQEMIKAQQMLIAKGGDLKSIVNAPIRIEATPEAEVIK